MAGPLSVAVADDSRTGFATCTQQAEPATGHANRVPLGTGRSTAVTTTPSSV